MATSSLTAPTATAGGLSSEDDDKAEATTNLTETISFLSKLSSKEQKDWTLKLDEFVLHHALHDHRRPIAVVSSGGTAVDLEVNSVRCLENFSTGLRGAISVEELLIRGYAVIHLWREGSTSPFARVLSQHLKQKQTNHALSVDSIGRLLRVKGDGGSGDDADEIVKAVLEQDRQQQDPFLTEPMSSSSSNLRHQLRLRRHHNDTENDEVSLARSVMHSSRVHKALRSRAVALDENRLLTVPFRTVDDYLARLELIAISVRDCQSLVLFYMAAAVSDFYIPAHQRATHKIQSATDDGGGGLVLHLQPVPKALGMLRNVWAPEAFLVSFKLETDMEILRTKAEGAMSKYKSHLVIGNLLQSRHDKVWILSSSSSPPEEEGKSNDDATSTTNTVDPSFSSTYNFVEITRPRASTRHDEDDDDSDIDSLESSIIDFVVQSHFTFISTHFYVGGGGGDDAGFKAASRAQQAILEKKRNVQRERFWKQVESIGLEIAGALMAVVLSYSINSTLQRRLRGD